MFESFYGGMPGADFVIKYVFHSYQEMIDTDKKSDSKIKINYGDYCYIDGVTQEGKNVYNGINWDEHGYIYQKSLEGENNFKQIGCFRGPGLNDGVADIAIVPYQLDKDEQPTYLSIRGYETPSDEFLKNNAVAYKYKKVENTTKTEDGEDAKVTTGVHVGFEMPDLKIGLIADVNDKTYDAKIESIKNDPFDKVFKLTVPKGKDGNTVENLLSIPSKIVTSAIVYPVTSDGYNPTVGTKLSNDKILDIKDNNLHIEKDTNKNTILVYTDSDNKEYFTSLSNCYEYTLCWTGKEYVVEKDGDTSKTVEKPVTKTIGKQNYIDEVIVVPPGEGDLSYHFLVYFSDEKYRNMFTNIVRYKSSRYPGAMLDFVDFGNIKGEEEGLRIEGKLTRISEDTFYPAEPYIQGFSRTLEEDGKTYLYCYDYSIKKWYTAGVVELAQDPKNTIVISKANENFLPDESEIRSLRKGGIWFAVEEAQYAGM